jgi:RNA polymerase sigma-70 factor (ECF subfamily)
MGVPQNTRPSLLVRIRDAQDNAAWSQFVEIYAPLIYGFARRHGLQDADAADLTQEVLRVVARSARGLEYDPSRGSFRGWLFTVVRNKLRSLLDARHRQPQGTGDSEQNFFEDQPDRDAQESAFWDQEHERRLFVWAADQVRNEVNESNAFWRTAIDGQSGKEVAALLGMSVAAVYLAKSRVMARLKELVRQTSDD